MTKSNIQWACLGNTLFLMKCFKKPIQKRQKTQVLKLKDNYTEYFEIVVFQVLFKMNFQYFKSVPEIIFKFFKYLKNHFQVFQVSRWFSSIFSSMKKIHSSIIKYFKYFKYPLATLIRSDFAIVWDEKVGKGGWNERAHTNVILWQ